MKFKKMEDHEFLKEEMDQDMIDRKKRRAGWYRKYADLDEGAAIDMNNLDEWALNAAGCEGRCSVEDIKEALQESILTEAPAANLKGTLKQAANDIEAEEVVAENQSKGQIESALDRALKTARRVAGKRGVTYPNVLFISEAGMGKTFITQKWAADNGINLVPIRGSVLDATDIGGLFAQPEKGARVAPRVLTGLFEPLKEPNSVLFLDELNRASVPVRNALLELINSHTLPDPNNLKGGDIFFPNFLFTIATINPPTGDYNVTALDPAEKTRFRNVRLAGDPLYTLKYLEKKYTGDAEEARKAGDTQEALENEGRKKLAQTILTSKRFSFDDRDDMIAGDNKLGDVYIPLNTRSFEEILDNSNGTKEDLLYLWNDYANPLKKSTIEGILANYVDVDDKANDALKGGTESEVFKKKTSPLDKLKAAYSELNI